MNSYIFHICFILFILLSNLIFDFVCLTLSSADTHGIAKYARTYIQDTHTLAHTHQKKSRKIRKKPSPPCFVQNLLLSISAFCLDEKGCWRIFVLCTHIHEFLYISHLFHFIYFIVISNI